MKVLNYLIDSLELDVYPHRIPMIAVGTTFIVSVIVGYFAFVK